MTEIDEHVAVVGGGIAGVLCALLARRAGYREVTLVEQREHVLSDTSLLATRLHLGSEYPKSPETGVDCLLGALVYRRMLPDVYADVEPTRVAVALATERDAAQGLTLERCAASYAHIRLAYQRHLEQLRSLEAWTNAEAEAQLFGAPQRLFEPLSREALEDLCAVAGGFATREPMLNVPRLGAFLEAALLQLKVRVLTHTRVLAIHARGEHGYALQTRELEPLPCDQVVDARWYGALAGELGRRASLHLRLIAMVDTAPLSAAERRRTTLVLLGEHGGTFNPYDEHTGLVYLPAPGLGHHETGAWQAGSDPGEPLPRHWLEILRDGVPDEHARLEAYLDAATAGPLAFLSGARPLELHARVAVSFEDNLEQRRHQPPMELTPGRIASVPVKASLAALTALQTLQLLLSRSVVRGRLSQAQRADLLGATETLPYALPPQLLLHGAGR